MSESLQHHGLQHAKLLCPSLSPWVCSTSCPWWVGDAIQTTSSSVIPFSSYLQSFKASGFFSNESALHITWSEYCSFTFSTSPSNDYSGLISFRINRFDLLAVQGTLKSLLQRRNSKASSALRLLYGPILTAIHGYWKNHSFRPLLTKRCLCFFNTLSMCVIAFLPRSKHLLISWLQSPFTVIHSDFGAKENKIYHCFHLIPIHLPLKDGIGCHDLSFWMLNFKSSFSLFDRHQEALCSSSAIRVVSSAYLKLLIFLHAILIPVYELSSLAFSMTYSACKLNKQVDNIQPWHTPFPVLNQSVVPDSMSGSKCCFLTCLQVSQETGKVVYIPISKNFT